MKIAITAKEASLQGEVDPRFGRCAHFIIYDLDNDSHNVVGNLQDLNAVHGAGIQAAEKVARQGVKALLTGNCGPNAFRVLGAAGVEVFIGVSGTVFEAINAFKRGELNKSEAANVSGHW